MVMLPHACYPVASSWLPPTHPPPPHDLPPPAPPRLPQNLANLAWALATLGCGSSLGFMDSLVEAAQAQLPSFTPAELANLAWALAR